MALVGGGMQTPLQLLEYLVSVLADLRDDLQDQRTSMRAHSQKHSFDTRHGLLDRGTRSADPKYTVPARIWETIQLDAPGSPECEWSKLTIHEMLSHAVALTCAYITCLCPPTTDAPVAVERCLRAWASAEAASPTGLCLPQLTLVCRKNGLVERSLEVICAHHDRGTPKLLLTPPTYKVDAPPVPADGPDVICCTSGLHHTNKKPRIQATTVHIPDPTALTCPPCVAWYEQRQRLETSARRALQEASGVLKEGMSLLGLLERATNAAVVPDLATAAVGGTCFVCGAPAEREHPLCAYLPGNSASCASCANRINGREYGTDILGQPLSCYVCGEALGVDFVGCANCGMACCITDSPLVCDVVTSGADAEGGGGCEWCGQPVGDDGDGGDGDDGGGGDDDDDDDGDDGGDGGDDDDGSRCKLCKLCKHLHKRPAMLGARTGSCVACRLPSHIRARLRSTRATITARAPPAPSRDRRDGEAYVRSVAEFNRCRQSPPTGIRAKLSERYKMAGASRVALARADAFCDFLKSHPQRVPRASLPDLAADVKQAGGVVVLDFFAGVGTTLLALLTMNVRVAVYVYVERDDEAAQTIEANYGVCTRCVRVADDILSLGGHERATETLSGTLRSLGYQGFHLITAGTPCLDLSANRRPDAYGNRMGLLGDCSSLFWVVASIATRLIHDQVERGGLVPVLVHENVASMHRVDRELIECSLGLPSYVTCASTLSCPGVEPLPARRRRLFTQNAPVSELEQGVEALRADDLLPPGASAHTDVLPCITRRAWRNGSGFSVRDLLLHRKETPPLLIQPDRYSQTVRPLTPSEMLTFLGHPSDELDRVYVAATNARRLVASSVALNQMCHALSGFVAALMRTDSTVAQQTQVVVCATVESVRDRYRQTLATVPPRSRWVMCDLCDKWRRALGEVLEDSPYECADRPVVRESDGTWCCVVVGCLDPECPY